MPTTCYSAVVGSIDQPSGSGNHQNRDAKTSAQGEMRISPPHFQNQSLSRNLAVDVVFVGYNQEVVNISAVDSAIQKQYELDYSDVPMSYLFDFDYFFADQSYYLSLRSFILQNSVDNSWTSGFNETAMQYQMDTGTKMAVFLNQSGRAIDAPAVETWLADNPCVPQARQVCTFYILNFTDFDSPDHLTEHWYNITEYDVDSNHIRDFPTTQALNNPLNPEVRYPLPAFSSKQNLVYIDPSAFTWDLNFSRLVFRLNVSGPKYQYFYQDLDAFLATYDINTEDGKSALAQYLGGWIDDFMFNVGPDNFLPLASDGYSYMPTLAESFSVQTLVLNDHIHTELATEELHWIFNATVLQEAVRELLPYANPKSSARFADLDDYPEIAFIWNDCIISVQDGQTVINGTKLWYALDNVRQKYFNVTEAEHVVCCYAFVLNNTGIKYEGYWVAGLGAANQVLVFRNKPALFSPLDGTIRQKGLTWTITHEMGHCVGYIHTSTWAERLYPHYVGDFAADPMGGYVYSYRFCKIRTELFRRTLADMKLLNLLDKLVQDEYWYNQGPPSAGIDFLFDRIREEIEQVNLSYDKLQYLESIYLLDRVEQLEDVLSSLVKPKAALSWPMFRNDSYHLGCSDSTAPCTNNTLWNYTTGGAVLSSPAVADGKLYVGSNDRKVYCLNASDGSSIWSYTTDGWVISSPAYADDKVYVGSDDRKLYCLNASSGSLIWSYMTGNPVWSSPTVVNNKVYFGSYDARIYCLNASDGTLLWNYTAGNSVLSSPAVTGDKVYVGAFDGKVYCLNASDGTHLWNYSTENFFDSSPAVAGDKVYVGSEDHSVYCLNASDGSLIWNHATNGTIFFSSPAVADGKVYVGSNDNVTYCLNASDGTVIWNFATGGRIYSSPAVADGRVYLGSKDRKVYCLNASNGELIWSLTTDYWIETSSPAVAYGNVYIGSDDGRVYAIGPPSNHNLKVKNVRTSKSGSSQETVGQNYTCSINVTIQNIGDHDENPQIAVYVNTTRIATQIATLPHNSLTTVSFTWNTTGYAIGNYTIWAYVQPTSDEAYRLDNILLGGSVKVVLPGDINGDGYVGIDDIFTVAFHFGAEAGQPGYDPICDINGDGYIGIDDLFIAASHFGQENP